MLSSVASASWAFDRAFDRPAFVVSVPSVPNAEVRVVPDGRAGDGAGRLSAEVAATPSSAAQSTRTCAGAFLRELVKRPDMPERDSIYRAPLDAATFLVLYIVERAGHKVLHAHLLAAVAGTHCVDAHFSRDMRDGEDVDGWRTTFAGASIREGGR